jgi:conjugative relaxase-like TrwC/TraI family protein
MLSVAKLSPGQEAYYERSVAQGIDDYYAGRGESPGIWFGAGAETLGLVGVVADGALRQIVDGVDPATQNRLRSHAKPRTFTTERTDSITGDRIHVQQMLAPVAGFDLVFSVPKSVSLLHALGGDELRFAVSRAHQESWHAAMTYLEEEACVVRRGGQGRISERAGGFVAAAFQHRTSRAQDPHLHTHVIVANLAQSPHDGGWRALDGRPLLEQHRLAAGYLYQSHLRAALARSIGVEWSEPHKGMAEIDGVPRAVLTDFSQRRAQIVERLDQTGLTGFHAAQQAAVETRDRKEDADLHRLVEEWWARAEEHGFGRADLTTPLGRAVWTDPEVAAKDDLIAQLVGDHGLTEKRTTFTRADVIVAIAHAARCGLDAPDVVALADRLLTDDAVAMLSESLPGAAGRYSTEQLLLLEREALATAERGRDADAPSIPPEAAARALASSTPELSDEQAAYVLSAAIDDDRVVCVVGIAGAGKTTATRCLAEALAANGVIVVGAAPSGAAARTLGDATGIPTYTVHRLLNDAARDGGLPHRAVVIVDEAGMVDTRTLTALLREIEAADAKLVLVGDPEQLPSVGAGGLFRAIIERVGAVELQQNRRQRDPAERAALAAIRDGHGHDYADWAAHNERLVVAPHAIAARTRLLADWWQHAQHDPARNAMVALKRRDAAILNSLGRALMDSNGRLGRERIVAGDREYATGDRIVCLRNNDLLGVQNGTRGTVTAVDRTRGVLTIASDSGTVVTLSAHYLADGHLSYGYALTGHSAQGATFERAYVLGDPDRALKEWGYVGLSRAETSTHVYIADGPSPHTGGIEPDTRDRFGAALGRSTSELLASDVGL